MIFALAVLAAFVVIGGVFVSSMILTDRKSNAQLLRNKPDTSQDSGFATDNGHSIADGCDAGGGD